MSLPKLVSPLLDGFVMGDSISSHDGIQCCPAMKENTDDKYIVKVISIPASQVQLEALLLTGAYSDPAAAMDYFKALSDSVVEEAELLQKLSQLEGFVPFEAWQIVPMEENRLGYDVYLLSSYRKSLDKFIRRNPVTHLAAVNLGIDLCAALSVCRNAGYLYADLRPGNVYLCGDQDYRIGDLGFVSISSMKYNSLPAKYVSPYTAPEMHDPMNTVNNTVDIYALGMILYQIYNNGVLPFRGKAPDEELPTPLNADYEIAEIIMKAISPDVASRWQDPADMGQALVAYMQRNVINDVPINPPLAVLTDETPAAEEPETVTEPEVESGTESETEQPQCETEETSGEDEPSDPESNDAPHAAAEFEDTQSKLTDPMDSTTVLPQDSGEMLPLTTEFKEEDAASDDRKTTVLPHAQTVTKPKFHFFDDDDDETDYDDDDEEDEENEEEDSRDNRPYNPRAGRRKKKTGMVIMMVVLLLIAALCYGGYYFYRNIYQQTINSLEVKGERNEIYVTVDSEIDPTLLTVVCSDSYGNTKRMVLTDGTAVFTDLNPDTMYQIHLEVSGYHELVGSKSGSYTTAAETKILNFTGVTGSIDGSVVLNFSVEGPEGEWILHYSAEGEEPKTMTFTGHTVNVSDLTVGKTYTFTLEPSTSLYIVTDTSIEFTASKLILAENLEIVSCSGGELTAQWTTPADTSVESWNVVCYGDGGYIANAVATENTITFQDIDTTQAYTVEVTAAGMTQAVRTSITANPITVGELHTDASDPEKLVFTWDYEGDAPEGGWLLMYSIDGSDYQAVVQCDTNSAVVSPRIHGATYTVTIYSANATTIFTKEHTYTCPDAELFSGYGISADLLKANMLVTPKDGWTYKLVTNKDYTTSFKLGQKISLLLRSPYDFYLDRDPIRILFVVRDSDGNVITDLIGTHESTWYSLWYNKPSYHYCELDLPKAPTEAGNYTVSVYFNGYEMCTVDFKVS